MKTFNKTIIVAVLLIGLASCSGNQQNNSAPKKKTKGTDIVSVTKEEEGYFCVTFTNSAQLVFRQLEDNTLAVDELTNYKSFHGDVTIPEQIEYESVSYPVTIIGVEAFSGCEGMTSVTIPNSVRKIESVAFEYCKGLTSIDIPNSVESIGSHVFRHCSGLTSVTVQHPGFRFDDDGSLADLFDGCDNLEKSNVVQGKGYVEGDLVYIDSSKERLVRCSSTAKGAITIPTGVTSIGALAFYGCKDVTSVAIPEGVKKIGFAAFRGCGSLASINIPSSVIEIVNLHFGEDAERGLLNNFVFDGCDNLTNVTIYNPELYYLFCDNPKTVVYLKQNESNKHPNDQQNFEDGLVYSDDSKTKVVYCSPSVSGAVLIPKSVKEIDELVFNGFRGLLIVQNPNLQIEYYPSKILYQAEDGSLCSAENKMNQSSYSDNPAQDSRLHVYSNAYDGFVNIRQAPQSKAPILGVLRNGPEGAILLGTEGEWKKIDCNGIVGYVYEKYVQDTPTEVFHGE